MPNPLHKRLEEEFRERAIRAETEGVRKREEGKHEAATHREGESTAFTRAAFLVHLAALDQPELGEDCKRCGGTGAEVNYGPNPVPVRIPCPDCSGKHPDPPEVSDACQIRIDRFCAGEPWRWALLADGRKIAGRAGFAMRREAEQDAAESWASALNKNTEEGE